MLRLITLLCSMTCILVAVVSADESAETERIAGAFKTYCVKCHGEGEDNEGDVNLLQASAGSLVSNLDLVQSLVGVLDLQEMPPEGETELPDKLRLQLVDDLKQVLRSHEGSYTHTPIRRMNRFQYNNAVADLFNLKCNVFTLPERIVRDHSKYFQPASGKMPELVRVGCRPLGKSQLIERRLMGVAAFPQDLRAEHGYDNQGDHLSLSPLLMESFLKIAHSIVESPDFVAKQVGTWKSFFVAPGGNADREVVVRRRLTEFLTTAFRQPPDEPTINRYVSYVQRQLASGVDFTDAMKSVAAAVIASPRFLYLYDTSNKDPESDLVDDFELASRLSFFLWGSLPDQELLDLAAAGSLRKPEVLNKQFDRMIRDPKVKRFCDSFPAQWLQLDRILSTTPDRKKFPGFYFSPYRNSMHMLMEPLLLFETVLIENHAVTELIDPSFTYRSAKLETAYGDLGNEPPPKAGGGSTVLTFHRVAPKDRRTGGVITNAAVMAMTSGAERTQPITRGAWIAGVIFNNPPEPPPANVPALDEKPDPDEEQLTLRERLAMHRKRSDCKGCHEQIDPLGFALENYDPIGQWRDKYENDRDIDVAGTLFRKHDFANVEEFKDAILAEKDRFTRGLVGHLLSFALARQLDAADQIALDAIAKETASDGYKFQTLLRQVILSKPFHSKHTK